MRDFVRVRGRERFSSESTKTRVPGSGKDSSSGILTWGALEKFTHSGLPGKVSIFKLFKISKLRSGM